MRAHIKLRICTRWLIYKYSTCNGIVIRTSTYNMCTGYRYRFEIWEVCRQAPVTCSYDVDSDFCLPRALSPVSKSPLRAHFCW